MKKLIVFLLTLFVLAGNAYAGEIKTFGFDDYRHRDNNVAGIHFIPAWKHNGGASYSQPLILSGDRWGGQFTGKKLVVTVEGNTLNGYVDPGGTPNGFKQLNPLWTVTLSGDTPTKSHPTFVEKDGNKYIYIGTYSRYFDIVDVTDFSEVDHSKIKSIGNPNSTDITSAPLVLSWHGHEVVVCTSGNTGRVNIIADPLDDSKVNSIGIQVGTGRTSSSPAPVAGGAGFAVGLDGGFGVRGELQIYYLDDILGEDADGKVVKISENARAVKPLESGLVASFTTDGDMLYFGDSQSRVYGYNTATQTGWMNTGAAGIFSNRSPALTPTRIYFPATGYAPDNDKGKVVAIDRTTGITIWTVPFADTAQTAPAVFRAPEMPGLLEGTGNGYLVFINPVDGKEINEFDVSQKLSSEAYARGVTGEISAMDDLAVVGTEMGVVAFRLQPLGNLKASSLDLGIPEGQKAEPDMEYTATIVFENEADRMYPETPVAVLHGQYQATLYDENGQILPKKTIGEKDVQVADFDKKGTPGARRTFTCKWHPLNQPTDGLNGMVNRDEIGKVHQEVTYADNVISKDVQVNSANYDIMVQIESGMPGKTVWSTSMNPADMWVNVTVTRKDTQPGTLPVRLTIDALADQQVIDLPSFDQKDVYTYSWQACTSGSDYNVTAQAWPFDGSWEDVYPPDNTDSITITYEYFELKPLDNKLHSEVIDSSF